MTHPTGLHEEIKQGMDLKSGLNPKGYIPPTLRKLVYDKLPQVEKYKYDNAHEEGLVPLPPYKGGSKIKRKIKTKRTTKRNRNSKSSRSLRGKSKTKTKTRKQK